MRKFLAVSVGIMVLSAGVGLKSQEVSAAQVDGVTQAWDKNIPSGSRFTVLAAFGGAAVRDNNTGLVWERAPDAATRAQNGASEIGFGATLHCLDRNVGGTRGWRLPSVVELASLIDPALAAPFVPASVFTGIQSFVYWSATTSLPEGPGFAWAVHFGIAGTGPRDVRVTDSRAWCVRGDMNADAY